MKKVILKVEICVINDEETPLDYQRILLSLISNPADGMNLAEMRNVEKIYDKLEAVECPGYMLLEDAEHATLKQILESVKFKVFNKTIKAMVESVIASPLMTPPPA